MSWWGSRGGWGGGLRMVVGLVHSGGPGDCGGQGWSLGGDRAQGWWTSRGSGAPRGGGGSCLGVVRVQEVVGCGCVGPWGGVLGVVGVQG